MILGIMQPYFFPHLGYFDLINYADKWIVFDNVKYIRHGWVNRNRIHHPAQGWQYVGVPLRKHDSRARICDIEINYELDWQQKILGQLQHYRRHSRRFEETITLVESCLSETELSISRLNALVLDRVCQHLGIRFTFEFFSDLKLAIEPVQDPGDWALNISSALGATRYVNPPGGRDLFDQDKFEMRGIALEFRDIPPISYKCTPYEFIPRLSIIDVLMWNSPKSIFEYLQQHKHPQE